ncbi:MAG: hypothetical protein IKJ69_02430 [Clostridia bacterium]|nr:hypothetical protein [Clostridia bacterium]
MKKLTKTRKILLAILAVVVLLAGVLFFNIDKILFPYDNVTISDPIGDKIEEKNAVSFRTFYFTDEEYPSYSSYKELERWDSFVGNCEDSKSGEITIAHNVGAEAAGESLDFKKLAFNGEAYTLTCDGHFYMDHGETEDLKVSSCNTVDCKKRTFKYLKKFDIKFSTEIYGLKQYRFYVLTNIEDLTAETYERDYLDTDSEVYKNSYLAYVKFYSAQD